MNGTSSLTDTQQLTELIAAQRKRICDAGEDPTGIPFWIQFPLESFNMFEWLKALPDYDRVYWSNREQTIQFAGIGNVLPSNYFASDQLSRQLDHIHRILHIANASETLWAFVAGAFSVSERPDDVWSDFPSQLIVLPELSIIQNGNSLTAVVTTLLTDTSSVESHLPRMVELVALLEKFQVIDCSEFSARDRYDQPGLNEWNHAVLEATRSIRAGLIDKVVLARRTDFTLEKMTDPIDLLALLSKSNPRCYQILFAPSGDAAFLCLSPERLFRCAGPLLSTEAVAGTVSRGASEIEDLALENRLRNSAKDRAEQEFVVDGITKSLKPLAEKIEVSAAASVMKLSRVQHLISEFRSILKTDTSLGDLYSALHPTAAVCGTPREAALRILTDLEKFDRGWYAGGVGVVSANESEFAVGIRSAVLCKDRLSIFTGAGIVSQSNPSEEWLEVEDKMHSIIDFVDRTSD